MWQTMRDTVSTKEEDKDLYLKLSSDLQHTQITHAKENRNKKKRRKMKEIRKRKKNEEEEGKAEDTVGLQNHWKQTMA